MTDEQRAEVGQRVENTLLLSLETAVDVLAQVIAGELRVAVKTTLKNGQSLHELLLVPGPKPVIAVLGFEELKQGVFTLKDRLGHDAAAAFLARHLPEGQRLAYAGTRPELWPAMAAELNELLGSWRLTDAEIEALSDPV